MIGIPVGLLYSNAVEWLVHKYVLHGLGKRKGSWWSFHWREHHKNCRKYGMKDPDFQKPITDWNARGKEVASIALLCAAHLPLAGVAPYFTAAVWFAGFNYLRKHRKSHRDPEWAMKHMKWHVDHHLGKNQDANWCVTRPWFDRVMGTRIDYAKELLRLPKREKRKLESGVYDVPEPATVANDVNLGSSETTDDESPSVFPPPIAA